MAIAIGATLAHEMGHNLGMSHDANDCVCSGDSCIMSASLRYAKKKKKNPEKSWSQGVLLHLGHTVILLVEV